MIFQGDWGNFFPESCLQTYNQRVNGLSPHMKNIFSCPNLKVLEEKMMEAQQKKQQQQLIPPHQAVQQIPNDLVNPVEQGLVQRAGTFRFATSPDLFNVIHRELGPCVRNRHAFVLYDFSGNCPPAWRNVVQLGPSDLKQYILDNQDSFKMTELQQHVPKDQNELISKCKRSFNVIVIFHEPNRISALFNEMLTQKTMIQNYPINLKEYNGGILNGIINVQQQMNNPQLNNNNQMNAVELMEQQQNILLDWIVERLPEIEGTPEFLNLRCALALYRRLKAEKVSEVQIFIDPLHQFMRERPFIDQYMSHLGECTISYPNEILEGRLFLGNWKQAASAEVLRNLGITHVLNTTQEVQNFFEMDDNFSVSYLKLVLEDVEGEDIARVFERAFAFLDKAFESRPDAKVLVHCAHGRSRSVTLVLMYLMRKYRMSFEQAFEYVRIKRDMAQPIDAFKGALKKFQVNNYSFDETPDSESQKKTTPH